MTEKRYFEKRLEEEYYIFDSNTISESDFEKKLEYQDYRAFEDSMMGDEVVNRLNELSDENEKLKQQLKNIENSFKFSCTENHIEFNKDKLKVEDTHTELTLKDGKLYISVFIPQLNEYVKFFYLVTGRKMEREFINYDGDV